MQPPWEVVWQLPEELSTGPPYAPAIPLLAVYARDVKARVHTHVCMNAHSSGICNSPRLRVGEHTGASTRQNTARLYEGINIQATTWMDPNVTTLSEARQAEYMLYDSIHVKSEKVQANL